MKMEKLNLMFLGLSPTFLLRPLSLSKRAELTQGIASLSSLPMRDLLHHLADACLSPCHGQYFTAQSLQKNTSNSTV